LNLISAKLERNSLEGQLFVWLFQSHIQELEGDILWALCLE